MPPHSQRYGTLKFIVYNVHSLMGDERLELLYQELEKVEWDVIVLVETWREEALEKFTTDRDHLWCGFLWNEWQKRHRFPFETPR